LKTISLKPVYSHHIVIPLASINRAVVETICYAKSLSSRVTAIHIAVDEEEAKKWEKKWNDWNPGIPLVIRSTPYRDIIDPLVEYVDELIQQKKDKNDKITILIPQFIAINVWENYFLHNQSSFYIGQALVLKHKDVIVCNYPYYVDLS
jgi:hypothetical protein